MAIKRIHGVPCIFLRSVSTKNTRKNPNLLKRKARGTYRKSPANYKPQTINYKLYPLINTCIVSGVCCCKMISQSLHNSPTIF